MLVIPPSFSPDFGQFIGSIIPLASDRFGERFFDCDEPQRDTGPVGHLETFRKVGVLTGVNQAMQCEPVVQSGRCNPCQPFVRPWLDLGSSPNAAISDSSGALRSHCGFRFIDKYPPNM